MITRQFRERTRFKFITHVYILMLLTRCSIMLPLTFRVDCLLQLLKILWENTVHKYFYNLYFKLITFH